MRGFLQLLIFLLFKLENFAFEEICNLPSECHIIQSNHNDGIISTSIECDLSKKQSDSAIKIENCTQVKDDIMTEVFLDSNSKLIIDNTSFSSIIGYLNSQSFIRKKLTINQIRGLNIESNIQVQIQNLFTMVFSLVPDFYDQQGYVVKGCRDFERLNYPSFFLKTNDTDKTLDFELDIIQSTVLICELFFKDSQLSYLSFNYLANTYFKKRTVEIEKSLNKTRLNSNILTLSFSSCYEINLNEKMFNENMFESTKTVWISCSINAIKADYFTNFKSLNTIEISPTAFLTLTRRQGIDWIKQMNHDVNVDLANGTEVMRYLHLIKVIRLYPEKKVFWNKNFQFVYDEDFCLFKDFPIDQMVFLLIDNKNSILDEIKIKKITQDSSCTLLWLYRFNFYFKIKNQRIFLNLSYINFRKCDFKKRFKNCNISRAVVRKEHEITFNIIDFMVLSEFLVIIASPLISVFGIITNTIIILVIIKKENRKDLGQKQYTYMAIHSVSNVFICFIQILNLVNQCQLPYGIYCSSIRLNVAIQYFKIVFGEYFSCFFRLFSNFTYVAFAINRLSLIGNNHNKITQFFSELNIKTYIVFSIVLSAVFPVVKPLRYQINTIELERYAPILFLDFNYIWSNDVVYKLLIIFNSVYDIVNYILFVILNLIIDILLIKKLREVMKERLEKVKNQIETAKEKVKKENEESFRRVINMVILGSFLNCLFKLPIVITSLNDLRLLISTSDLFFFDYFDDYENSIQFPYTMRYFCHSDKICGIFVEFGNFLFLLSLSVNFFFLKKFDKNFHSAYKSFKPKK